MLPHLQALLRPRGIAVVGATPNTDKFSGRIVPALLRGRFRGRIYPVNPRYSEVAGLPCYRSVREVPDPCDLAIIAVPAAHVPDTVAEAAERGLGAAVILSSGFEEVGGEGEARAERLRSLTPRIRLYGPNCPGLWQIRDGVVYTFTAQFHPDQLVAGPVGLISQGGALGRAVLDAMDQGLGFSYWFSTGNETDLEAADFVEFLAQDPGTGVLALILEGFRDGRRFLAAASACRAAGKPVMVLKVGRTAPGARAALQHTAKRNGRGFIVDALLEQAGCVRVDDLDELTDLARLFARYPHPPEGGLAVCSFSGGMGGLLADQAALHGVPLTRLQPSTEAALRSLLPPIAAIGNPTDLTTAVLDNPALARAALETMAADPGVALVLFPLPHRLDAFDEAMARELVELAGVSPKPLAVVASSPSFEMEAAAQILLRGGVPVFRTARAAVRASARWLGTRSARRPPAIPPWPAEGRPGASPLTPAEWAALLERHGLPRAERGAPLLHCAVSEEPGFGPVLACRGTSLPPSGTWAVRLLPLGPEEAEALCAELDVGGPCAPEALAALGRLALEQRGRFDRVETVLGMHEGRAVVLDVTLEVTT
ncbi:MAG: CoA-binding protein [Firmicutes bacterium]|nr:CoA-binding protein [Bacillota bacterium]